jgi:hypothetical protein
MVGTIPRLVLAGKRGLEEFFLRPDPSANIDLDQLLQIPCRFFLAFTLQQDAGGAPGISLGSGALSVRCRSDYSGDRDGDDPPHQVVRFGSNPEVRGSLKLGPLCGVERTLKLGTSAHRTKAVVREGGAELPFIARNGLNRRHSHQSPQPLAKVLLNRLEFAVQICDASCKGG